MDILQEDFQQDRRVDLWLNDVALGTGQIDLPGILRVAQELGIKHYFIEDESPIVVEQIPHSLRFLESLSW